MSDLPPIPENIRRYARGRGGALPGEWTEQVIDRALDAAWPHLYAAALHHAATDVLDNDDACSDLLREAAFTILDRPPTPE